MAVAYDSAVSGGSVGGVSSLTYSFTNTAGSHVAVGAGIEWFGVNVSTITYAGAGLTISWNANFGTFYGHAGGYLASPATGANNVVVTMTGTADKITSGAISVNGSGGVGTPSATSGSGTTASTSVSSATNDMVVAFLSANISEDWVVESGQTERFRTGTGVTATYGSTEPGAATVVSQWNEAFLGSVWGIGAIPFTASGGGGGSLPPCSLTKLTAVQRAGFH